MGSKKQPQMPDLPDINEMVNAQAKANRVDSHNIMGSNTFSQNSDGTWSQQQEYSPLAKAMLEKQMGTLFSSPKTFTSGRPQAVNDMYSQMAAKFGANGNLPTPQVQGQPEQGQDVSQLIAGSLPETKQALQAQQQNNSWKMPNLPFMQGGQFGGRR